MYQSTILREVALNPIWEEADGRVIAEVDSIPLKGVHTRALSFKGVWNEWAAETGLPGYTGACAYRWNGPDLTWNPGSGLLRFRLHLTASGDYRLALRSRRAEAGAGDSCFVRVDGGQWWIARSSASEDWSWETLRETAPDQAEPWREALSAGFHQIEIAGRLNGFCLDRLALARDGAAFEDPALPVSSQRPR